MRVPVSAAKRIALCLLALAFAVLCLPCAAEDACPLIGKWRYVGLTDPVLTVRADGTADYQDLRWTWTDDGSALTLTCLSTGRNDITTALRYRQDESGLWIYPLTTYVRSGEGAEDSLVGSWYVEATPRVSFIFREDGTFAEDTAFSGTYTVDAEAGTFRLDYGGLFDPIVCPYTLSDGRLYVFYPWQIEACP